MLCRRHGYKGEPFFRGLHFSPEGPDDSKGLGSDIPVSGRGHQHQLVADFSFEPIQQSPADHNAVSVIRYKVLSLDNCLADE